MNKRDGHPRRIFILVAIMAVIVSTVVLVASVSFYRTEIGVQSFHLAEIARIQAHWIESVARFDAEFSAQDHPEGGFGATMAQLREMYEGHPGKRESEQSQLVELQGSTIVFLLAEKGGTFVTREPLPIESGIPGSHQRALSGESGTMVGPDHRGVTVLAAFEPLAIEGRTMGVVEKVDLAELRGPFIRVGLWIGLLGLFLISMGAWLFRRVGEPLVRDLEASERKFREVAAEQAESLSLLNGILNGADDAIHAKDSAGRYVMANAAVAAAMGRSVPEILGKSDVELLGSEAGAEIVSGDLPTVIGDRSQLARVFQNLVGNALKEGKIRNTLHVATDGVEAMEFLRREGDHADAPRPDLILLDLNLPRKNGREVLAEVKADDDLKRIPVVILTISQAEEDVFRSYNLNANCYINKPVDLTQFMKVVKSIEDFWLTVVTLPNGHDA